MTKFLNEHFSPLLGESVWHSITVDPTLQEVSELHCRAVQDILARHGQHLPANPYILEVAAYAHTTGYSLSQLVGARSTLLDISASTLKLGRNAARQRNLTTDQTRLVAADFHALPFDDEQFHVVFICSALHHTRNWQLVLGELIRVLTPGGLLLLENEPCLREFSFYRFSCNRINNFTPFEAKLDQLGIIRTVAEPYLGSRPESLFGMVENQKIPLDELMGAVKNTCDLIELSLMPEVCMGPLEREMLKNRTMDASTLTDWVTSTLGGLISQATPALGHIEKGLGFSLPDEKEIAALSSKVAGLLKELPNPTSPSLRQHFIAMLFRLARFRRKLIRQLESLPIPSLGRMLARAMKIPTELQSQITSVVTSYSSDPFREGISRLFGANVKIVARKHGVAPPQPEGRFNATYTEQDGVVLGFEPTMLKLLAQCSAISPNLQSATEDAVREVFPLEDWAIEILRMKEATDDEPQLDVSKKTSDQHVRNLVSRSDRGKILLPLKPGRSLILLRCHATYHDHPYRIVLLHEESELNKMEVYQSESFLLTGIAETTNLSDKGLLLKIVAPNGGEAPPAARVSLVYAAAVNL